VLAQIVDATGALSAVFRTGQGREEHSRKDRDNRNDDQEFDERESSRGLHGRRQGRILLVIHIG
jgi:hypothetical protein